MDRFLDFRKALRIIGQKQTDNLVDKATIAIETFQQHPVIDHLLCLVVLNEVVGTIRAGTDGIPPATFSSDKNNFAPRIGFCLAPLSSDNLSLRAAYGIFYDVGILNSNHYPDSTRP